MVTESRSVMHCFYLYCNRYGKDMRDAQHSMFEKYILTCEHPSLP